MSHRFENISVFDSSNQIKKINNRGVAGIPADNKMENFVTIVDG